MAGRLEELMKQSRREQENLKKSELRALQAQINPHFLYNTLDAIVWLAESGSTDEVVHITRALSDFFRISLSQGRDWIEVAEELKHLRGYLTIQKVRYRDILDYEIDVPPEAQEGLILKLLLQPLWKTPFTTASSSAAAAARCAWWGGARANNCTSP